LSPITVIQFMFTGMQRPTIQKLSKGCLVIF
jgi:hypothetical protein